MWKDIPSWEETYEINENGEVRNKITGNYIKGDINNGGYYRVCLYRKPRKQRYFRHRLVAELFIPNPNNYKEVNHKDEDKTNNSVDNLEWCSAKYNSNYGTRNERMSKSLTNNIYTSREVDVYDLDMNFIETLPSSKECGRKYKVHHSNVRNCCNGGKWSDKTHTTWLKVNRVGNYIFRWHK